MDVDAARKARRREIKADLAEAYTDEEAGPPEWVDLLNRARDEKEAIASDVAEETRRFVAEPDIRDALARRERFAKRTGERIAKLNASIRRLNLLAPHPRFTRGELDAEEVLRALYRANRRPS